MSHFEATSLRSMDCALQPARRAIAYRDAPAGKQTPQAVTSDIHSAVGALGVAVVPVPQAPRRARLIVVSKLLHFPA